MIHFKTPATLHFARLAGKNAAQLPSVRLNLLGSAQTHLRQKKVSVICN
jgi:hypothetical protein